MLYDANTKIHRNGVPEADRVRVRMPVVLYVPELLLRRQLERIRQDRSAEYNRRDALPEHGAEPEAGARKVLYSAMHDAQLYREPDRQALH